MAGGLIGVPMGIVVQLAEKVHILEAENAIHLHHPEVDWIALGSPQRQTIARKYHVQVLLNSMYSDLYSKIKCKFRVSTYHNAFFHMIRNNN